MDKGNLKLSGAIAFLLIVVTAGTAEAALPALGGFFGQEREVLLTGQLLTESCLAEGKLSACYIGSVSNSPVVLFSNRNLYRIELGRAPQWKVDSAFGKQAVIKGVVKGSKIIVNDAVALGGNKKISKACL